MTTTLTDSELADGLADVLSRVRRGERFVIELDGVPIADLVPAEPVTTSTMAEVMAKIGHLMPVGDGFADDLEAIHASQGRIGPLPPRRA